MNLAYNIYSIIQKTILNTLPYNTFIIAQLSDNLYFGSLPKYYRDVKELENRNIDIIISLNQDHEFIFIKEDILDTLNKNFIRYQFPTQDFYNVHENNINKIIKIFLQNPNKKIFIHCFKGKDRSASVATILFKIKNGLTPSQAISYVENKHKHVFMNSLQKQSIYAQ